MTTNTEFGHLLNGRNSFSHEMLAGEQGAEGHITFEWDNGWTVTAEAYRAFPNVLHSTVVFGTGAFGPYLWLKDIEHTEEGEEEFYAFLEAASGNVREDYFNKWFVEIK